ncbi:MAG: HD-GYP domain-containing protein [Caldilineaceae bacterium]
MYDKSSISSAAAIVFAAALVSGGAGVLVTSTVIALVHYIGVRNQFYKALFNLSTHILAGMAPVLLAYQFHGIFHEAISLEVLWILIPGTGVAAILYFMVETGLVAIAISLSEGLRLRTVWNEQFRWLLRPYVVLGVLGMFLALAYISMGMVGVFVYLLPVLGLHHLQRMYVDRTQNSVRELRRMNSELAEANQQINIGKASIERMNQELMLTLSRIIDARDPFVSGHASKVADYARAVAVHLDLSEQQIDAIYQAGLLHDIGKMGIPERILLKPGALTDEEYEIVKQHTIIGADFLLTSQALQHLAPVIRSHHEQWNGGGYPAGLRGDEIPLEARILSVCDAVEAMASDRPYQRNKPIQAILSELQRCAGEQFDPAVVEAFLAVVESQPHLIGNSAEDVVQTYSQMTSPLNAKRISRWHGKPQLAVEVT